MRIRTAHVLVIGAVLHLGCGAPGAPPPQSQLTFNEHIAPLVWHRCGGCHRPGGVAPFSLLGYEEVRRRARQIVEVTGNRVMPPWLPEPGYGEFAGERRLRQEEIDQIARWVEQGTVEGDPAGRRSPPTWADGWELGEPDVVVALPQPYTLPAGGRDIFRNFAIPIPLSTRRYVRGLEFRPGSRGLVHHATILIDRTRASRLLDEEDPEPGYEGMFSDTARNPESLALGWTPGKTPVLEPAEMAWRLEPGSDMVLQLHLLPSGKPEIIQASVGLYFSDTPPTLVPIDFKLGSKAIDIPAGERNYTVEDTYRLPVDVRAVSVYPHAHYLARDMQAFATLPDGTVTWLIRIKSWDFNWQDQYRYATPVVLPRGTVLTMRYTYDNSAENPRNPHQPPRPVVYGPESSDEMGDFWIRLLPRTMTDARVLAQSYIDHEFRKDVALAEQMVERHPREARWHNLLGARYVEGGRVQEGIARLEEALRLMPDHAEAHNNLGHALRLQDRLSEAIVHFRHAARLAPRNDLVHFNLANALQDAGELDEAIRHFRESIALNPHSADAHNDLGVALGSRGLTAEAAQHFQRALDIQPEHTGARENLRLVRP